MPSAPMPLGLPDIEKRLPHRAPILLVGAVKAWEPNTSLTATRHFPETDPVFQGHFPGHPILPGMLTIEALAQAAGLLVNLTLDKTAEETLFYFMGVEEARFRAPVHPGATLTLSITLQQQRGTVYRFAGTATLADGTVAATATFTAKLVLKNPEEGAA